MKDGNAWGYMSIAAYCWYDNDSAAYENTHGALYNWHTVNTGKLCPIGWHVPTEDEWIALITPIGGESRAGLKLKESGTGDFTALYSGARGIDGAFGWLGMYGFWWSATEVDFNTARYLYIINADSYAKLATVNNMLGYSVRCLKDN